MIDIRYQLEQAASDEGVPLRTDIRQLLERARADRRRQRIRSTAFAALPTAAVLAVGGVLGSSGLPAESGGNGDPAGAPPAGTLHSTNPGTSDPGLSPTPGNLYQILVTADGWTFDGMDNSRDGEGSQYWTNGGQWLEVQRYPASQYDAFLQGLRDDTGLTERAVKMLGQSGHEFTYKPTSFSPSDHGGLFEVPSPSGTGGTADGPRINTILPPVGDYFLIIDAYTTDKTALDDVIGSLTRVDKGAWEQAIDVATVTEAEGEAFLSDANQGVPMPDGVEVTVDDLNLPQSPYHARAAFVGPVLCGWATQYVAGDQQALRTLRDSRDWPVLQAMTTEGDYPEAVAASIEQLVSGSTDKGTPYALEDFALAVGC